MFLFSIENPKKKSFNQYQFCFCFRFHLILQSNGIHANIIPFTYIFGSFIHTYYNIYIILIVRLTCITHFMEWYIISNPSNDQYISNMLFKTKRENKKTHKATSKSYYLIIIYKFNYGISKTNTTKKMMSNKPIKPN